MATLSAETSPEQHANTELTSSQTGQRLDLTARRVRQIADQGLLVYKRTPLGRLFDASSVEALARAREEARSARQHP